MKRIKFYLEKMKFLILFAWWREWTLFSEEWKMTYLELEDARGRSYELYRAAVLRILKGIEEHTEEKENEGV